MKPILFRTQGNELYRRFVKKELLSYHYNLYDSH